MVALGFLIFSSGFVITLVMALWKMLTHDWDNEKFTGASVIKHFKLPLLFFVLLLLFIVYGVPYLEA